MVASRRDLATTDEPDLTFNESAKNANERESRMIRKDERIDLHLSGPAKAMLQRAAAVRHKTVSEFVLDSAQAAAAETLADRREFLLDEGQWQAFLAALDAPEKPKPGLDELLGAKSVFE